MPMFRWILLCTWFLSRASLAESQQDPVDFQQKIGAAVPKELEFRNEEGQRITLGSILGQGQAAILALAYFHCETLCPLVLNGIVKATNDIDPKRLSRIQVVVVSIDPRDTAQAAAERKRILLQRTSGALNAQSLHFLTGYAPAIDQLAKAIGFRYRFDPKTGQYQHPSGLTILTANGQVSRYFFGIEYAPSDVRAALDEASHNSLGRVLRQLVLACYRYDAATGTYTLAIYKIMRAFDIAMLLGGGVMVLLWERRRLQAK